MDGYLGNHSINRGLVPLWERTENSSGVPTNSDTSAPTYTVYDKDGNVVAGPGIAMNSVTTGVYRHGISLVPGTYKPNQGYVIYVQYAMSASNRGRLLWFTTNTTKDNPAWYYVDNVTGSDANHGLTPALPFATINQALGVCAPFDVIGVVPNAGVPYRERIRPRCSAILQSLRNGTTTISQTDPDDLSDMVDVRESTDPLDIGSWVLHDAGTNTYRMEDWDIPGSPGTPQPTYQIRLADELDANGHWLELDHVAALVSGGLATAGTWFNDEAANTLYVRMPTGTPADPATHEIEASVQTRGLSMSDSDATTIKYLEVRGFVFTMARSDGVLLWNVAGNNILHGKFSNCVFRYAGNNITGVSSLGMGFASVGEITTELIGCRAYGNALDGFNYHHGGVHYETLCVSEHNRDDGTSAHEFGVHIIKDGIYRYNDKGGVINVYHCLTSVEDSIAEGQRRGFANYDPGGYMTIKDSYAVGNSEGGVIASDGAHVAYRNLVSKDNSGDGNFAAIGSPDGTFTDMTADDVWAESFWGYAARTLTQSAAQVTALIGNGTLITLYRGDTFTAALTDVGSLTGNTKLWFTVKDDFSDTDAEALFQIEKTGGLLRLNGIAPTGGLSSADGSLTVNDAASGDVTIVLSAAAAATLVPDMDYKYDLQMLSASGVLTVARGDFRVTADVSRVTS